MASNNVAQFASELKMPADLLLKQLKAEGMAVIIVEHDMDLVFRVANRITVLVRGAVLTEGAPADIAADVHWAGRVNWNRPRYYATADIHCTPCQRASFGMVLLEAMSCGRPVVASRISGFQLLMEHGKQGLLISPAESVERFAEALTYLVERPEERDRMGREGRKTAVTEYAWSKVAAQLEEHYLGLIERGPRR